MPSIDPDAPTEAASEYDGFLSYATEWHAAGIGGAAGLVAALSYGTALQPAGLAIAVAVVAAALGISVGKRVSTRVAAEVRDEPWYALGALLALFVMTSALRTLLGL